jgi:hypothetical protein
MIPVLALATALVFTLLGDSVAAFWSEHGPGRVDQGEKADPLEPVLSGSDPDLYPACGDAESRLETIEVGEHSVIAARDMKQLLIDSPGPSYKNPTDTARESGAQTASYMPDQKLWAAALERYGFEFGWARRWDPPRNKPAVATEVWKLGSPEDAIGFQTFVTRLVCVSSIESFDVPETDGAIGFEIPTQIGVLEQVTFVRGREFYLVAAAMDDVPDGHSFVEGLAQLAESKADELPVYADDDPYPACTLALDLARQLPNEIEDLPAPHAMAAEELIRYLLRSEPTEEMPLEPDVYSLAPTTTLGGGLGARFMWRLSRMSLADQTIRQFDDPSDVVPAIVEMIELECHKIDETLEIPDVPGAFLLTLREPAGTATRTTHRIVLARGAVVTIINRHLETVTPDVLHKTMQSARKAAELQS